MNKDQISVRTKMKRILIVLLCLGALVLIGGLVLARALDPTSTLPLDREAREKETNLYQNPQSVQIDGYNDDCMEPFITGDGNYLLFNNSNSCLVDTHIHLCKRISKNHFRHLGLLPGSVSKSKDMAPTIDAHGNLFYTCLLTYEKDGHSIYRGNFADEKLQNISLPEGDISPHKPAEINMDCDVSKDGNTLILSRAHFANYLLPPDKSDLVLAEKREGKFAFDTKRQLVLSALNTDSLEYAPCQTSDQLELYFTRASKKSVAGNPNKYEPYLRLMVARRKDRYSDYDEPERISPLTGFIEAPTITDDKQELFFHKKMGEKFRIFCATRSRN